MNVALWIAQGLLAALFLFAGGTKLILPIEEMTKEIALPGLFLRFIGVAEVLGRWLNHDLLKCPPPTLDRPEN